MFVNRHHLVKVHCIIEHRTLFPETRRILNSEFLHLFRDRVIHRTGCIFYTETIDVHVLVKITPVKTGMLEEKINNLKQHFCFVIVTEPAHALECLAQCHVGVYLVSFQYSLHHRHGVFVQPGIHYQGR